MKTLEIPSFEVTGFVIRTTNSEEMNPATAKIGMLWERFYANASSQLSEDSRLYGVYTNYESDSSAAFDVIACSNTLSPEKLEKSVQLQIHAGKYLVFSREGNMPAAVIDLWKEIWEYFSAETCSHTRAYTTDFEYYKSENNIEIAISIT